MDKQIIDRQTDRQTERQEDRDRYKDRQTVRQRVFSLYNMNKYRFFNVGDFVDAFCKTLTVLD